MNKKISSLLCLFLCIAAIVYSMSQGAHEFQNSQCTICHSSSAPGGAGMMSGSLTGKCMTCHTDLYEDSYMHPVDIAPKNAQVPGDLPLSPQGFITCNTCHDAHAPQETPYGTKSSFLRRFESGKAFCSICHRTAGNKYGHQTVFRSAHLTTKPTEISAFLGIDAMSRNCLSCHDGAFASSVNLNAGQWRQSENFSFSANNNGGMHPIGMNYTEIQTSKAKAMLKPLFQVDKRIRLFNNGNVGCGSCHDPYSALDKSLVIENRQSNLCFACHKGNGR